MGDVDPKVASSFGANLKGAVEALKRWEQKCAEVHKQYKKLHPPMVADAGANFKQSKWNSAVSDAPRSLPIAGMKQKDEKQFTDVDGQKKKCDEVIKQLKNLVEQLNKSRTSGIGTVHQLEAGMHEAPSFISKLVARVSRGEMLVVLEVKGGWMHVRNGSGVEGWVHKSDLTPGLPVELNSKQGEGGERWKGREKDLDSNWGGRG